MLMHHTVSAYVFTVSDISYYANSFAYTLTLSDSSHAQTESYTKVFFFSRHQQPQVVQPHLLDVLLLNEAECATRKDPLSSRQCRNVLLDGVLAHEIEHVHCGCMLWRRFPRERVRDGDGDRALWHARKKNRRTQHHYPCYYYIPW